MIKIEAALIMISEYFMDGYLALMALAFLAPILGCHLVLRRMPIFALSVPQTASCGQALVYLAWTSYALHREWSELEPQSWLIYTGGAVGVLVGLLVLVRLVKDRQHLGVAAALMFILAGAVTELAKKSSPLQSGPAESQLSGDVLTLVADDRIFVLITVIPLLIATCFFHRSMWISAVDEIQSRLLRISPVWNLFVLLALLGIFSSLTVPLVGAELVFALLLIPAGILRAATPSLKLYAPLAVAAAVIGVQVAFVLACHEDFDWPLAPALILALTFISIVLAFFAKLYQRLRH